METWSPAFCFEISEVPDRRKRRSRGSLMLKSAPFASATSTLGNNSAPACPPPKVLHSKFWYQINSLTYSVYVVLVPFVADLADSKS